MKKFGLQWFTYQYYLGKEQGCGNKVNCFLRTEILFFWSHSFGSQIRLRMHFRASRTLWFATPSTMAVCHKEQGCGNKVNCFLRTEILFFWNHSFRSQIKLRMHLRASPTLWLLGALAAPRPREMKVCHAQRTLQKE